MQEYDFKMLKLNTNTSVTQLNYNDVHEKLVLFHGHPIVTLPALLSVRIRCGRKTAEHQNKLRDNNMKIR